MKRSIKGVIAFIPVPLAVLIAGSLTLATALAATAPTVVPPENDKGNYAPGNTLILYGDMVVGSGSKGLVTCALNNRYEPEQSVVFRMTALKPAQGTFDDTAVLTVKVTTATGAVLFEKDMNYRGSDAPPKVPQPGFWTVRWTVPKGTAPQVLEYSVHATDAQGRTGNWEPYNKASSKLTITPPSQ